MTRHGGARLRNALIGIALLLIAGSLYARARIEAHLNRVTPVPLPTPSAEALRLHDASFVADLHADSLLWGRDLSQRSTLGQVDLPRLRDGGVDLQVFGGVTWVPLGVDVENTRRGVVDLLLLPGFLLSPGMAFDDSFGRARRQAARLDALVERSAGELRWVRTRADLDALAAAGGDATGALYALEGAHVFADEGASLEQAFDFGVRMVGLAHFFDNAFVGSAHGTERGGLSERGRALVAEMERRGVVIDLAHVSPAGVRDVLAMVRRPVVVSHTGVAATCDNPRNLTDDQLRAIARGGGVVGIGYFELAVCGFRVEDVLAAIGHVIDTVGDRHVGLGSDFDGTVETGFDTAQLPALTQALLDAGYSAETVQRIVGGNVLRVLREALPER